MSLAPEDIEVVHVPAQGAAWRRRLVWQAGMTLAQAVSASGLEEAFPGLDWKLQGAGVFGRQLPPGAPLQPGDRVEVYRSLQLDPKLARMRRAQGEDRRRQQPVGPG
jgi:hypothetical protein